jgi:hypothetical protein
MTMAELLDVKSLLNKAFRLNKGSARNKAKLAPVQNDGNQTHDACRQGPEVLTQKDSQLAELRANWVKVHEAFQQSQELLHRRTQSLPSCERTG